MEASKYINKCISNVANNISCPERVACYFDKILTCYIGGSNKFTYDPSDRNIEKYIKDKDYYNFNEFKINTEDLDKIIENIKNPKKKIGVFDIVKEKFGITKKTISKKDMEKITEYERNIKSKSNK